MVSFSQRVALILVSLLAFANVALASPTQAEMIDIAGRQRMLSQRIVKAYAQVAIDVQYDLAQQQLQDAVALFDQQLADLKFNSSSGKVQMALLKVEQQWAPLRAIATGPINADGARRLLAANDELLNACQQVVVELETIAGTNQAHVVNLAGRQRMLSQRIAKDYMLLSLGLKDPGLPVEMDKARGEFEAAMAELRKAPQNTPAIVSGLDEVERQWGVFRGSFQLKESGTYVPLFVAMASEKVLNLFNAITGLYARAK